MDLPVFQSLLLLAVGFVGGAAVVGIAWAVSRRSADTYSRHLKQRFGSEYERALDEHENRRDAELDLIEREQRAKELTIRPLRAAEAQSFRHRWRVIQSSFVDEPREALRDAHQLLEELMAQLGYPTNSYRDEIELVSVHHPDAVQHYREAHRLQQERDTGQDSTESERRALIHYRDLFAELLGEPVDEDERGHARDADGREPLRP